MDEIAWRSFLDEEFCCLHYLSALTIVAQYETHSSPAKLSCSLGMPSLTNWLVPRKPCKFSAMRDKSCDNSERLFSFRCISSALWFDVCKAKLAELLVKWTWSLALGYLTNFD